MVKFFEQRSAKRAAGIRISAVPRHDDAYACWPAEGRIIPLRSFFKWDSLKQCSNIKTLRVLDYICPIPISSGLTPDRNYPSIMRLLFSQSPRSYELAIKEPADRERFFKCFQINNIY